MKMLYLSGVCVCFLLSLKSAYTQKNDYFVDAHLNVNNIDGAVEPKKSNQYVKYLGEFDNTQQCQQACISASTDDNKCMTYTYQTSQLEPHDDFTKTCYGRFGYPLWNPSPQKYINSGQIIWKCVSPMDCSLNGICDTNNGNCTCSIGWKGYRCNQLDLLPSNKSAGYHAMNGGSSWGGAVVTDDKDTDENTKYHMFLSEFVNECGIDSWVINSQIVHARSTNGWNSEYQKVEVMQLPDAHEPDCIQSVQNDGKSVYALYYASYNRTVNGYPPCTHCHNGTTGNCNKQPDDPLFWTLMRYTNDLNDYGSWSEEQHLFGKAIDVDTNIATWILQNGSVIGMVRSNPDASIMHLIFADEWDDNSSYSEDTSNVLFPELTNWYCEDPYIWMDCHGNFHAIFHNLMPNRYLGIDGTHAYSEDGVNWVYGGFCFGDQVHFTDGSVETFYSLERPHIILSAKDKCTAVALTSGAFLNPDNGDKVFTLLQPIRQS